jgi:hypothetical protein
MQFLASRHPSGGMAGGMDSVLTDDKLININSLNQHNNS